MKLILTYLTIRSICSSLKAILNEDGFFGRLCICTYNLNIYILGVITLILITLIVPMIEL